VAEGVETQETWSRLAQLGCDTAQGFFISRPLPRIVLVEWLRKRDPRPQGVDSPKHSLAQARRHDLRVVEAPLDSEAV
jgi:predicted signal transduction protein with EAL and GGDEF domain